MTASARLPSVTLRPGVPFPDWSAVSSATARETVLAIFEAFGIESRWSDRAPAEDRVHMALLELYGKSGRAPGIGELAQRTAMTPETVRALLGNLAARDLVVLDDSGATILGAYPLTERDTDHRVRLGSRTLNAMCAIDALGTGAMFGRDVEIQSRCRNCGESIELTTRERGTGLAAVSPSTAVVWSGIRYEGGCAATSLCTVIAFFCCDAHMESWRATNHPDELGFRLSMDEALQAGRAIFEPMLARSEATADMPEAG